MSIVPAARSRPESPPPPRGRGTTPDIGRRYRKIFDEQGRYLYTEESYLTEEDILYPHEDDEFVSTEAHFEKLRQLQNLAKLRYGARRTDVAILTDTNLNLDLAGIRAIRPDLAIIEGVSGQPDHFTQGTFYLELETPEIRKRLAVEVCSPSTRTGDHNAKLFHYIDAGFEQYVILDVDDDEHPTRAIFLDHRPAPGSPGYRIIPPDDRGRVKLECLDAWVSLDLEANDLIFHDAQTGEEIEDFREVHIARKQESRRADDAEARAEEAEARARAESERASRLAEKLRALGIDPEA